MFSDDDRAVIEACHLVKRIGSPEDSERYWTNRKQGSGIPRTTVNDDKKAYVEEMIVSQEDQPGTHKSQREISRDLNVSRTSVRRMTNLRN